MRPRRDADGAPTARSAATRPPLAAAASTTTVRYRAFGSTVFNASAIFNASGMIDSFGYNLSSDDDSGFLTAIGDQINTDPMLGPLQDNGGPTFTHTLLSGSPAIDAGDPSFDPYSFSPPLLEDQRGAGFPRVVNDRIDIGAFEVPQPAPTPTPTPTSTSTPTPTPTPSPTPTATPTPAPAAPTALKPANVNAISFTANWSSIGEATGYRLDVSTSSVFNSYVPGYQNLDVGNTTS